jgi:hypothetical protein
MYMERRELDSVETTILERLRLADLELIDHPDTHKNAVWTSRFFDELHALATADGFICRTSKHGGEVLWDVTWCLQSGSRPEAQELMLSCECEWNLSIEGILSDFRKLTMSAAVYRIMIFCATKERDFLTVIERLKAATPRYSGDYLAICVQGWGQREDRLLRYDAWGESRANA